MKMLIKLKERESSKEIIKSITEREFENLTIHIDEKSFEITIRGDFYIGMDTNIIGEQKICVENEDYIYALFNASDIERMIIKDIK